MRRRPPRSTLPYTLFPYPTLFRSLLLDGCQARQVERDRLCQGRQHRRGRRGADEPPRIGAHRGVESEGRRRKGGLGRTAHDRLGGGVGRVLPVCRWAACRRRGGRSEGRRGGKACVSTGRYRGWPYNDKKKQKLEESKQ